jgi:hypothetical protein
MMRPVAASMEVVLLVGGCCPIVVLPAGRSYLTAAIELVESVVFAVTIELVGFAVFVVTIESVAVVVRTAGSLLLMA